MTPKELIMLKALEEVRDYLQRNENFLPETPDKDEIASIVMEAIAEGVRL
jgi:hypothetical protein